MSTKKPVNRFLPDDWHRSLQNLRQASNETREASFCLRQETSHLRNELENKEEWDYKDNTTLLQDRTYEIRRVHEDLVTSLKQVKTELNKLKNAKETAEREVEFLLTPIEVNLECLTLRERRRDGDLVRDDVEIQLEEEHNTLQKSRSDLEKLVLDAVSHLRVLQDIIQQLEIDITDKESAIKIDSDQAALTEFSPNVSLKKEPMKVLQNALLPVDWLKHSTDNMNTADLAIKESQELRDTLFVAIQKTRQDDEAKQRETDFALRRRLHQETRARDELQWEKDNLLNEIGEQEREISHLESCLNHSMLPLKVAHTRLENRHWRRGKDLVEDAPQEGLRHEVSHLRTSRDHLRKNLENACETLYSLQYKLRIVDADLVRKNLSVNLETKAKGVRSKLYQSNFMPTVTEQNLLQTGSLMPHPTQILH